MIKRSDYYYFYVKKIVYVLLYLRRSPQQQSCGLPAQQGAAANPPLPVVTFVATQHNTSASKKFVMS